MTQKRAIHALPVLFLLCAGLVACDSEDSGGTTIRSTEDGIVGVDDETDGPEG